MMNKILISTALALATVALVSGQTTNKRHYSSNGNRPVGGGIISGSGGFGQGGFGQGGFGQGGFGQGGHGGGIGGGGAVGIISGGGGSSSGSCRYWCRTPQGQAYCCEGGNEPTSYPSVKPGQCPPVRPQCPPVRGFRPPSTCSNDSRCPGSEKCCFDTCLQHHSCKPSQYH